MHSVKSVSQGYVEISRSVQATVESVFLYGAETRGITNNWTNKIQKFLDGCYTGMLRAAFNVSWKDETTNQQLYGDLLLLLQKLKKEDFDLLGIVSEVKRKKASIHVLWTPKYKKPGRPPTTYVDVLGNLKDTCLTTEERETTITGVRSRST